MAAWVEALDQAVVVTQTHAKPVPILFASPHSGRLYPNDFGSCQPLSILRQAEDAYVDELIGGAADLGVTLVQALFPRAYLDVNRDEDDLDPRIVEGLEGTDLGPKSKMGIGLIRRVITPDQPIYDRKLDLAEVRARMNKCYYPYHAALTEALSGLARLGTPKVFVDWHSMKSIGNASTPDGPGAVRPDVVLGDRHGKSCAASLTSCVAEHFRNAGYSVSINDPYAGRATLDRYGDPEAGTHGLQIELNRALYLDEVTVEATGYMQVLKKDIQNLVSVLTDWQQSGPCE